MNTNKNVVAKFTNKYGEEKVIHATRHGLKVKRTDITVALELNRKAAQIMGRKIKELRLNKDMTLEQLCFKSGLKSATPKSRMWEIENAIRKEGVRLGILYALAYALECEPWDLLPSTKELLMEVEISEIAEKTLSMTLSNNV